MASGFGFDGEANDDVRFCVLDGDGAGTVDVVYGTASVNTSSWYRFVVDLDLKNNVIRWIFTTWEPRTPR